MLAVLQFDAVSVPRIEQLLDQGRLPNLAALRARGRWVDLESTAANFPAAAYATLYSGVDIADHGLYYAFQWSPGHQRVRWRGDFPQPLMIWERVARAGKRTLVIDPYECIEPHLANGVAVAGYQLVNVMSLPRWSTPRSAAKQLDRLFGAPRFVNEVFGRPNARGLLELRRRLLDATERVTEAAVHLLRRDAYDLVWVNMLAGHLGGHMFWDLSQVDSRLLDDATRTTLSAALDDIYELMDAGLGRIVAELPAADIVVTAPIGMGVNISRVDLLPAMLEAVLSSNGEARTESRAERFVWNLRGAVPTSARAKVASALHGPLTRELTMRLSSLGVDWDKTPAFMLPSDHFGQVRLNIRGRERQGIVEGAEAGELVERIRAGLTSFREADGTQTAVAVDATRDLVGDGPFVDLLPDVVVKWSDTPAHGIDRVSSPAHGEVRRPGTGSGRSGAHTPYAWALLAPTSLDYAEPELPHILDIAATVCAALGVEADGLPGRPLLAA
ncbi:MAG: alkaline phosphatase family protein [Gaiellaceae bacterium]